MPRKKSKRKVAIITLAVMAVLGVLYVNSVYIVQANQLGVVFENGKPVYFGTPENEEAVVYPGLQFKKPFIQKVYFIEGFDKPFEVKDIQLLDANKKSVILSVKGIYTIGAPHDFVKNMGDSRRFQMRLESIINNKIRNIIASQHTNDGVVVEQPFITSQLKQDVEKEIYDLGVDLQKLEIKFPNKPKISFSDSTKQDQNPLADD